MSMRQTNDTAEHIADIVVRQREYFRSGATLSYEFRHRQLKLLKVALERWERQLLKALWDDMHKSEEEAVLTEFGIVRGELRMHLAKLRRWMRRRRVASPLKLFPSRSSIIAEPLGNTLIMSPWNYPVNLLLTPLVGAISSGCTAILKPSPYVPQVSETLARMIRETFDEEYITVVQGNREVNKMLLRQRFDMIFFTGSPSLGREVMKAASENLTPVVLELGGKSPCIVDRTADVAIAARRIAWGKTLNAGQTCVAPDYLLIHRSQKEAFVKAFSDEIRRLHGDDVRADRHYVRMINDAAFQRVSAYLADGRIVCGGSTNAAERYIEPTLLDDVSADAPVMQEEIFGPILPMLTFETIEEVIDFVGGREKPLALYYFGDEQSCRDVIRCTSSGGACINDVIMHLSNEKLPFGGVGHSGMGAYHGEASFRVFSHLRSVVSSPTWIDLPFRYMPYKMFGVIKKLL